VIFEVVCRAVANLPNPLKIRVTVSSSRQSRTALRRSVRRHNEGNTGYQYRCGALAQVPRHSAEFTPAPDFNTAVAEESSAEGHRRCALDNPFKPTGFASEQRRAKHLYRKRSRTIEGASEPAVKGANLASTGVQNRGMHAELH